MLDMVNFMSKEDFKPTKLSMITILLASMLMLMEGAAVAHLHCLL